MITAYMYNSNGYYVGSMIVYEDYLPNNSTTTPVEVIDGYIPKWNGKMWENIENHLGKQGYVNNEPFTIKDYGTLPKGWSDTPPEPTDEEKYFAEKGIIEAKYEKETLASLKSEILTSLCRISPDEETVNILKSKYQAELEKLKQDIDAVKKKYSMSENVA